MTEPTCDNCIHSGPCFIKRDFDKRLFRVRVGYTDCSQLEIERGFHKTIARKCMHYKGLDDEIV